jgi:hypothetical protein
MHNHNDERDAATIIQSFVRGKKARKQYIRSSYERFIQRLWERQENYVNTSQLSRYAAIEEWNNININKNIPCLVRRQHAFRPEVNMEFQ